MKFFLLSSLLFASLAFAKTPFYSDDFSQKIAQHLVKDEALKQELFKSTTAHHKAVGYGPAKKFLFGQIHLKQDANGKYFVEDVYCKKLFNNGVGPGNVPDQNQINTEHTWPQSKFTGSFDNETQKSDLHHLYPTDSKANSTRGNHEFAEVTRNQNLGSDCVSSKSGPSTLSGGTNYFEPPTEHKGNVARAIFYFSVRYKVSIADEQEEFLKRWNDIDPVDQDEITRNEQIEKIQGNRNPFIDFPNLAHDISNF